MTQLTTDFTTPEPTPARFYKVSFLNEVPESGTYRFTYYFSLAKPLDEYSELALDRIGEAITFRMDPTRDYKRGFKFYEVDVIRKKVKPAEAVFEYEAWFDRALQCVIDGPIYTLKDESKHASCDNICQLHHVLEN